MKTSSVQEGGGQSALDYLDLLGGGKYQKMKESSLKDPNSPILRSNSKFVTNKERLGGGSFLGGNIHNQGG